ncbi:MAG: UTP--glucose-1-phosphate uridylyltransferase [Holosporales bacterium]|jgi:UTP--glucose-1-phosphate uridylyltransferase|nr:UTP--glucose-1-phosphate uridylyltransferase [Holosporales bacterium]
MKKVKKAIFPVGGMGTRFLPATKAMPKEMLPVIDKPLIQYAVEEALSAGIEELIFITGRGKTAIEDHFDYSVELESMLNIRGNSSFIDDINKLVLPAGRIYYVRQQKPLGLGHAVWCARNLIQDEPFAVILADDLILEKNCLKELILSYDGGNMAAVMDVGPENVDKYGILDPALKDDKVVEAKGVVEKPQVGSAPSSIAIIGRYILQPEVFGYLENAKCGIRGEIQLTDAINAMLPTTSLRGIFFSGVRFDCGTKAGMVQSTIYSALNRKELAESTLSYISDLTKQV